MCYHGRLISPVYNGNRYSSLFPRKRKNTFFKSPVQQKWYQIWMQCSRSDQWTKFDLKQICRNPLFWLKLDEFGHFCGHIAQSTLHRDKIIESGFGTRKRPPPRWCTDMRLLFSREDLRRFLHNEKCNVMQFMGTVWFVQ